MSEVPTPLVSMNRLLGLAAILGGIFWIALAFFPLVGMREAAEDEVFWSRLWTPALLGMLLGFLGLYLTQRATFNRTARGGCVALLAGFTLMVSGNAVEYWILNDLPHQGPDGYIRGIAWMTFLVGTLVMLVATALVGFNGLKSDRIPRWLSGIFLLLFPSTIAIGFVSLHWAGVPLGIASIAVGLSGAWSSPRGTSTNPSSD